MSAAAAVTLRRQGDGRHRGQSPVADVHDKVRMIGCGMACMRRAWRTMYTDYEHGMPPAHQAWTGAVPGQPDGERYRRGPPARPDRRVAPQRPAFEPVIPPTVAALAELDPELVMPGHCTGWRAQHTLAAALPAAWIPSGTSSGTAVRLAAPPGPG